jgi:uncharacterized membrane protein YagU involved in acid resistance
MNYKLLSGAAAGISGGIPFGIMMTMMGSIKMIASMLGSQSVFIGWAVHLMISAGIGASFALLFSAPGRTRQGYLTRGTLYGAIWWFLGPLTMMPLMMSMPLGWNITAMSAMLPSLMGHLFFGLVLGWVFARLNVADISYAQQGQEG